MLSLFSFFMLFKGNDGLRGLPGYVGLKGNTGLKGNQENGASQIFENTILKASFHYVVLKRICSLLNVYDNAFE